MTRILCFIVIQFVAFAHVFANPTKEVYEEKNDSIHQKIQRFGEILSDPDWVISDYDNGGLLYGLYAFLHNEPIDTIVKDLGQVISDDDETLFYRKIENVKDFENIEDYVTNTAMVLLLDSVRWDYTDENPLDNIRIPQDFYIGFERKIPLIPYGEGERLFLDSIYTYPDSLIVDVEHNILITDSVEIINRQKADYEEMKRLEYNNITTQYYKDSLTHQYRDSIFQQGLQETLESFSDEVAVSNNILLRQYNTRIIEELNQEMNDILSELIVYADRYPHRLLIKKLGGWEHFDLGNNRPSSRWIWLRNSQQDSIGIRVDVINKETIQLMVDESVVFQQLESKETVNVGKVDVRNSMDQKLQTFKKELPKESPWKLYGKAYAGLTQNMQDGDWPKGGSSSASILATFSYNADYAKGETTWTNNIDTRLGYIYLANDDDAPWQKNNDYIKLNSRFGQKATEKWKYSADYKAETQIAPGYSYPDTDNQISRIFSPLKMSFAIGMDYNPKSNLSILASPLTLEGTFVTDTVRVDASNYGIPDGQKHNFQLGLTGNVAYNTDLMENVHLTTKNNFFFDYKQFWKMPDLESQTTIDLKINQWISAQLMLHLIFDKDDLTDTGDFDNNGDAIKEARLHVKETFTLGVTYNLR